MITIGQLRHRVDILAPTSTRNSFNEKITSYETVMMTVWASVEQLSGRELFHAQQIMADVTTRIRMRYLAGITPTHRIRFGSRIFSINYVIDPTGRGWELEILAKEIP